MTPGGVEDASFSMVAHPGIWFGAFVIATFGEDSAIAIMLFVHVGLVPAFNGGETFHVRMISLNDGLFESARAVTFKLGAHEFDVFWGVEKTVGRTMQRNKTSACRNKIEQSLFLFRSDPRVVGENEQAIVSSQASVVE